MAGKTQLGTATAAIMGRKYGSFSGKPVIITNPSFPNAATLSDSGVDNASLGGTGVQSANLSGTGVGSAMMTPRTS